MFPKIILCTLIAIGAIVRNVNGQNNYFSLKSCNTDFQFGDTCVENLMAPYFESNRLILCGEIHYYENNWLIKATLAKTLNAKYGVTRMFIEYPVSYENLYNDYLLYGDDLVIRNMSALTQDTLNEKLFLNNLRTYNLTRPDSLKITVICVDVEKNVLVSFRQLRLMLDGIFTRQIKKTKTLLDQFLSTKEMSDDSSIIAVNRIIENFKKYERTFRKQLSKMDFCKYKKIIEGLKLRYASSFGANSGGTNYDLFAEREIFLRLNVSEVLSAYPGEKFLGSFGLAHCMLVKEPQVFEGISIKSFAYELNNSKSSPVINNVCSIVQYYENYNDSLYLNKFLGGEKDIFTMQSVSNFTAFSLGSLNKTSASHFSLGQVLIINRNVLGPFMKN